MFYLGHAKIVILRFTDLDHIEILVIKMDNNNVLII